MNRTTCQSVLERLVEFLKLELPEIEEVAILRHLGHCPSCEAQRKSLERTLRFVEPFGAFEPSPGGFDRLMEKIHEEEGSRSARLGAHRARVVGAAVLAGAAASVAVIAALLAYGARPVDPPAPHGVRLALESGTILVRSGDAEHRIDGPARRDLAYGDEISNPSGQVASLSLAGVGDLHLDAGTRLVLAGRRNLRLESGEIFLEAQPSLDDPLRIETAHALAIVTGTTLDLEAGAARTALTVLEGSVRFVAAETGKEVDAGKRSIAATNAPPTEPETVPDLWRYRSWTSLSAELALDRDTVAPGEVATLRFRLTNRSSAPLSIVALVQLPYFHLRFEHADRVRPALPDMRRFKDDVPRSIRDGVLRLDPGEVYEFSYRLDPLEEPGRHDIAVVYNNGQEGASWRGYLEARATLWVVDDAGRTSAYLGVVQDPSRPDRTFHLWATGLPLEDARVLIERAGAERGWRDAVGALLGGGSTDDALEPAARIVTNLLGDGSRPIESGNLRLEPIGR